MPLITGTAISMSDLLLEIRDACTLNGWTLSGNVLHKDGCYARLTVVTGLAPATRPSIGTRDYLTISAGNGIDGSNNLTDAAGNTACIGPLTNGGGTTTLEYHDWTFPVSYSIHINTDPDEVWVAVQYNGLFFQHIAFGKSPAPGNPGTGNWFFATLNELAYTNSNQTYKNSTLVAYRADDQLGVGAFQEGNVIPQPFWIGNCNGNTPDTAGVGLINYSVHSLHGSTGAAAWSATGQGFLESSLPVGAIGGIAAYPTIYDIYTKMPNAWNSESVLLPCQLMKRRPSNFTSLAADIRHLRYLRIDNLEALDVIDKSPDLWRVYPCYQKSTTDPTNGIGNNSSGCHGIAVRYDA